MKIIFDTFIDGHHLEYIHHLYSYADAEEKYLFIIPKRFELIKDKFKWETKPNISFEYIESSELIKVEGSGHLLKSYRLARLLKYYIRRYSAASVFLISMIDYFPALFLFNMGVDISGIIYKIYLYEWNDYKWLEKVYEGLRQWTIVKSENTKKIFILNDKQSVSYLSRKWHTFKFSFLPDPYIPLQVVKNRDIRKQLGIPKTNLVFLHMGVMDYRKGTLDLLRSIKLIKNKSNITFVFAGKISERIHDEFYEEYHEIRESCQLLIFDEFCDYTFLGELSQIADCFVLPYKRASLSSGVLYYAAQFEKFVIGPSKGLLKKLIRRNGLGICIDCTPQSIANAIENYCGEKPNIKKEFITNSKVENFTSNIFNNI